MRPLLPSFALLVAAACTSTAPRPPPTDRFIYPAGLVHRSVPGSTNGVLYVASANFDRCFDDGTLMAVDLDRVGADTSRLPALGSATNSTPLDLAQLNVATESIRTIPSYAGEMSLWTRPEGQAPRLFIPTRSDGNNLYYVDVPEPTRLCAPGEGVDCAEGRVSLENVPGGASDVPRAPAPFGVAVSDEGEVWVTHLDPADAPARSLEEFRSYVVRLPGDSPSVSTESFVTLSTQELPMGGNSVVLGGRYAFVTGRFTSGITSLSRRFLVRVLDRTDPSRIIDPGLDVGFAALDARGLALTEQVASRPQRLYVAVRAPDSLLLVDVQGADSDLPRLTVVGSVPLPSGPTQVRLVSRGEARSELVVVSCSTAGVVAIFDPDVGQVVAQVQVGAEDGTETPQPFGLAVQQQGNAARIFTSNFGDGRVSVIDIPDLSNPQLARLVARLGTRQDLPGSTTCQEVQQ
jgi:DNA-binding beta-propeller fold protein YncE